MFNFDGFSDYLPDLVRGTSTSLELDDVRHAHQPALRASAASGQGRAFEAAAGPCFRLHRNHPRHSGASAAVLYLFRSSGFRHPPKPFHGRRHRPFNQLLGLSVRGLQGRDCRCSERTGGGCQSLYVEQVTQADTGCDFDFLVGRRDAGIPRNSH